MSERAVCVCGHDRDHHHAYIMSVPLVQLGPPLYEMLNPSNPFVAHIARTHTNSTYDRDECTICGCGDYYADGGDT